MTDDAFNEYLRDVIRREFPAALDSDPRAQLADGRIVVRGVPIEQAHAGWVMDIQPYRCMRQVLRAWQLCAEELERRSFA